MVATASIIPVPYHSRQGRPYRARSNANSPIVLSANGINSLLWQMFYVGE